MKRHIRWTAIACALLVFVAGLWAASHLRAAAAVDALKNASSQAVSAAAAPQGVEVVRPQRMTMSRKLDVPATIEAFEQADLYAKASGYISEVRVDIGDSVKQGDVLAVIDVPEMAKDVLEAKAQLAAKAAALQAADAHVLQAQKTLDMSRSQLQRYAADLRLREITLHRREELHGEKAVTDQDIDETRNQFELANADVGIAEKKIAVGEADVRSAQAARTLAEAQVQVAAAQVEKSETLMQYAHIVAPFDGVVTKRTIDRGALVQSAVAARTMPLFTVQRIDQVRIFVDVPETDVPFVRSGTPAKVKPYGWKDRTIEAKVARTAASLNPATRTMRVEIDLPNTDGRLLHGMYAQVVLEIDAHADALTVPAAALLTDGTAKYVYTVEENKAVRTPIKTGLDDGIRIEVTDGLRDDVQVVVTGKGLLTPGAAVKAVPKVGS